MEDLLPRCYINGWQVAASWWQDPQFLTTWTSPLSSLSILMNWQLSSLRESNLRRSNVFYDLVSEVTHNHFCNILLAIQDSAAHHGRGLYQGGRIIGAILGTGFHKCLSVSSIRLSSSLLSSLKCASQQGHHEQGSQGPGRCSRLANRQSRKTSFLLALTQPPHRGCFL